MKKKIFVMINILLFTVISQELKSQDTITIFFDNQWERCNKEQASYYRKYFKTQSKEYKAQDFYSSGQIEMSGTFKKKNWEEKIGHFVYYYRNGQKQTEGNYIDNLKNGKWISWRENGNVASEGDYKNGTRDGAWLFYFETGKISARETYENKKRTKWEFWDENSNTVDLSDAEYLPQFPGGEIAYTNFLINNVNYPKEAELNGIQGTVVVNIVVGTDGKIEDAKIQYPRNSYLDKEALRVVRLFPDFIPGKQHNRFVKVSFDVPIAFRL